MTCMTEISCMHRILHNCKENIGVEEWSNYDNYLKQKYITDYISNTNSGY